MVWNWLSEILSDFDFNVLSEIRDSCVCCAGDNGMRSVLYARKRSVLYTRNRLLKNKKYTRNRSLLGGVMVNQVSSCLRLVV